MIISKFEPNYCGNVLSLFTLEKDELVKHVAFKLPQLIQRLQFIMRTEMETLMKDETVSIKEGVFLSTKAVVMTIQIKFWLN